MQGFVPKIRGDAPCPKVFKENAKKAPMRGIRNSPSPAFSPDKKQAPPKNRERLQNAKGFLKISCLQLQQQLQQQSPRCASPGPRPSQSG